jgi:hypothetical protein
MRDGRLADRETYRALGKAEDADACASEIDRELDGIDSQQSEPRSDELEEFLAVVQAHLLEE